jgi:hypothetical protein
MASSPLEIRNMFSTKQLASLSGKRSQYGEKRSVSESLRPLNPKEKLKMELRVPISSAGPFRYFNFWPAVSPNLFPVFYFPLYHHRFMLACTLYLPPEIANERVLRLLLPGVMFSDEVLTAASSTFQWLLLAMMEIKGLIG